MTHYTTSPAKRDEHIADREEREHERAVLSAALRYGEPLDLGWPKVWLGAYRRALVELAERGEI